MCYHNSLAESLYVKEGSEEYNFDNKQNNKTRDKKHDKIFKEILQNPKEMAHLINKFTEFEVEEQDFESCNVNYITKGFKYKQADILYKIKEKDIYFLVEHQTKVDYSMSYRILNYCVEIMRSVINEKIINKVKYKYPKIIPIVLYTGNRIWTAETSFAKTQVCENGYEEKTIDVCYRLIDINKFEIGELLKEKTLLANVMALEKCKNNDEVINCLKKIIENEKNSDSENLKRIVIYLYAEIEKEIIKLMEKGKGENDMSTIQERITAEIRNGKKMAMKEGHAQGIAQTIKRMLKMNLKDDFIKQATGANIEQIVKLRKVIEK